VLVPLVDTTWCYRDESVLPLVKRKFSILAIVANATKVYGKNKSRTEVKWIRAEAYQAEHRRGFS
jgi:hypothetical protein